MNEPGINISFTEKASTAISRGERGIIAMIIRDSLPSGDRMMEIVREKDIPKTFSAASIRQIKNARKGYINPPKKVIVYCLSTGMEDVEETGGYTEALNALEAVRFHYLVAPTCETDGQTETIAAWVGEMRENGKMIKAVLPNTAADKEYIINYTTESVTDAGGNTYSAEGYCSRIAGLIAGTPMTISCTYAPLGELVDCTRLGRQERKTAMGKGQFLLYHDGEKVKVYAGVTSLVTLTEEKGEQFQKIRIVDAMDMIAEDIRRTAEDSYIGKYANSYDNKCVLISGITSYLKGLGRAVVSDYSVMIDIEANRTFLEEHGTDTAELSDNEVKQAPTGNKVYLSATVKLLDAMEEIHLPIMI